MIGAPKTVRIVPVEDHLENSPAKLASEQFCRDVQLSSAYVMPWENMPLRYQSKYLSRNIWQLVDF